MPAIQPCPSFASSCRFHHKPASGRWAILNDIAGPVEKIRERIGPGGKTIRSIVERTGVKIDVEDDGRINIASSDDSAAQKAIAIIQELTATPELDKVYMGRVERIADFGAFIEVMPGVDWAAPRGNTEWPTSATSSRKAKAWRRVIRGRVKRTPRPVAAAMTAAAVAATATVARAGIATGVREGSGT